VLRALVCALAGLAALCAAPAAHAGPPSESAVQPRAREHFDRGAAAAERRSFDEAARELEQAYGLDARRDYLFAWAQAERLRGDCTKAIALYRKFLEHRDLTASQVEAANLSISRCERTIEEQRGQPHAPIVGRPGDTTAAVANAAAGSATPSLHARSGAPAALSVAGDAAAGSSPAPPRSRLVAGLLLGASALALGTAATFYVWSLADERSARNAADYDPYHGAVEAARWKQRVGVGTLVAGVLLAGGGALEWFRAGPSRSASPAAAPREVAARLDILPWWRAGDAGIAVEGRY
jgi:hypothetical protein